MFGGTPAASSSGTSLFGSLNPTSSTAGGGGLFGGSAGGSTSLFGTQNTLGGNQKSLFGGTSTIGSGTGLFGSGTGVAGGGGGLFGSSTSNTGTSGLFGATNTQTSTGGGLFGGTSTGGLFGSKPTTGFGTLGQTNTSGFGTGTSLMGNTTGFGNTSGGLSGFSLNANQQNKNINQNQNLQQLVLHTALSNPQLFPDERNSVIASWNQLQASWGFGKAFYAPNAAPVELTAENSYCRFKTVAYCSLPSRKDEDGEVCVVIKKPVSELVNQQQMLIDTLFAKVFQSNQSISINIVSTKPLTDSQTEVVFYVQERLPTGYSKRIAASKLYQFLLQPTQSNQLTTSLAVHSFRPNKTINQQDLDLYLANPPAGIDKFLWQQAIANNPDPERLLPVPILGFNQLNQRLNQQLQMNEQHRSAVSSMHSELKSLKNRQAVSEAKLEEHKTKAIQLSHKLLICIGLIERVRKLGYPLQQDECTLHRQLEVIYQQLCQPTRLRSQLAELVSQAKLGSGSILRGGNSCYNENGQQVYQISAEHKQQLASFLKQQQEGIANLVQMMKSTCEEVKLIQNSLASSNVNSSTVTATT